MSYHPGGILLSLTYFPVLTLGPGRRLGIWTQGCSRRCPGCISKHTWEFDETKRVGWDRVSELLHQHRSKADGLTISGGEPFDQLAELVHLLELATGAGYTDILLYTGYTLEELRSALGDKFQLLRRLVSVIIDGPFVSQLRTDLVWKGSDNQRMHVLTSDPVLVERYGEFKDRKKDRKLQLVFSDGRLYLVGIP